MHEGAPSPQFLQGGACAVRSLGMTGGGGHHSSPHVDVDLIEFARPSRSAWPNMRAYCFCAGHQLGVRAALHDASVVEHDDLVGERDGRWAMRDDERRAAAHDLSQRGADPRLRLDVHARGRIVEDEDAGVHDERARNRDPLSLATAEREAALADDGRVAFGERGDEVIRLRREAAARAPPCRWLQGVRSGCSPRSRC